MGSGDAGDVPQLATDRGPSLSRGTESIGTCISCGGPLEGEHQQQEYCHSCVCFLTIASNNNALQEQQQLQKQRQQQQLLLQRRQQQQQQLLLLQQQQQQQSNENENENENLAVARLPSRTSLIKEVQHEPPSDAFEERSLAFFLKQAMPILSGCFDSHFSSRVLPQLMHKEPAIRHAVVAVSSFYEQYVAGNPLPGDQPAHGIHSFALRQYNKAIEHLTSPVLSHHPQHVMNVTLISCFLFVCVEFLRGNRERALAHLKSGLNILSNKAASQDGSEIAKAPSIYQYVEDELTQIFVRLNVQSSLFGQTMAPLNPKTATQTSSTSYTLDTFSNILEARTCLDYLLSVALRFIRTHSPARYVSAPDISVIVEQLKLDAQLCRWSVAFERLVKGRPESNSKGAIVLRVQHKVGSIWLNACLIAEETIFDKFGPDFETIVSQAELLYRDGFGTIGGNSTGSRNGSSDTTAGPFFFDMAIIPPLYFVAIKCRHPSGRRKAISLLVNSRHVEGMWNAFVVGKAAELVMAFEEEDLAQRMPFALPSEASRIHDTIIEYTGANSCWVTCRSKPNGIMGNWRVQQREIRW